MESRDRDPSRQGTLVGRNRELAAIEARLDAADRGRRGGFLELVGEPGIGKTRLLGELSRRADERGMLVLEGRASEFERELPFGVFVSALDDYMASLPVRTLKALGEARLGELAAIFPSLSQAGIAQASALLEERYRLHRAVASLLAVLAGRGPLLLAADDLHWADEGSIELTAHLVRQPPAARVLIALAYRPGHAPRRLQAALGGSVRDHLTRVELSPLSPGEARVLLGESIEEAQSELLYEESGGNPFYLLALARSPGFESKPGRKARSAAGDVPAAVAAAIGQEIGSLSEQSRAFLDAAAMSDDPFDLELAAVAAGQPTEQASMSVDELLSADMVRPTEVPNRFAFRHPLVRRAVYESIAIGRRLAAHRRLLAALRERGASASQLARHVEASARTGDLDAVALLAEAGSEVAPRAPGLAARRYEAALRLVPETRAAAVQRLGLLISLAHALAATGDLERAHELLLEALALVPPDQQTTAAGLVAFCAAIEHLLGRHDEAHARLRGALEALPDRRSPEAAALMIELAADAIYRSAHEDQTKWALEAREIARDCDAPSALATATALAGFGSCSLGRMDAARPLLDEACDAVDRLDDRLLSEHLDAPYYLAFAEWLGERYLDCVRHSQRALRLCRETGQGYLFIQLRVEEAIGLMGTGKVAEARVAAASALDAARLTGEDTAVQWACWAFAWVNRAVDLRPALAAAEEGAALASAGALGAYRGGIGWVLGGVLVEAGDAARAREVILDYCAGEELSNITPPLRCLAYELLTRAALELEDIGQAAAWADRARAGAVPLGLGVASAHARSATALVLLAERSPREAAREALEAAGCAQAAKAPLEVGRARILLGRALAGDGDHERALDELRRAHSCLAHCGAVRFRDEAARELRRLGERSPRRGARGTVAGALSVLSARELEVAEHVADGITNRKIAEALFLSEKTVETHLRSVFRKLGASSRAEVAGVIAAERARVP